MKMYLLTSQTSYDDYTVHGVYSSEEKAKLALAKDSIPAYFKYYDVEEREVDA